MIIEQEVCIKGALVEAGFLKNGTVLKVSSPAFYCCSIIRGWVVLAKPRIIKHDS